MIHSKNYRYPRDEKVLEFSELSLCVEHYRVKITRSAQGQFYDINDASSPKGDS